MRRWLGLDTNGWHDWAASDWTIEDPDIRQQQPIVRDGGVGSVVIEASDLSLMGLIGGPQASLAPHGRGDGWGMAVGAPERRRTVTDLWRTLLESEQVDNRWKRAFRASFDALTVGAKHVMLTMPDHERVAEAAQDRMLEALRGPMRPRVTLLWRSVALTLGLLDTDQLEQADDDTTLCLLIHDADGIEAQQLRLRRLTEHPEYLAPERERYGGLCCSELGLTSLSERLAGLVENNNSELQSPRAEKSRLPIKILTDQASPGSREILRRNNATWFEVTCPEIPSVSSLLPERDISLPESVTDADAAFLVTPLEGSLREALLALLQNYLPKLQLISSNTIAIGALKAGHRLERGIPHYLDRLDPIALAVMRQDGPVFEELIPQSATVPANKEYISDPIRNIVWVAQKDQVEFYIRKGSREIRAWKTESVTAPGEDQPVEIQLSQQPAQGWARVVVTSPIWDTLKRAPIRLNWSDLVPDDRTEAEILATLERPRPGIPDRVLYSANYDLWDGSERYPGVKRALQNFDADDAEAVDLLSEQLKAPFRPIGSPETYYPISTDGDLPAEASPDDSRLLDKIIAGVSQRLMEHTTGQRGRLRNNDLLQCAIWVFTRCPDEIQNLMIDAIEAVAGNRNHRLLAPRAAKRVVLHGLGRCISDQARIRKVLGIIVTLDQNTDTRAAVASILSRRDEAPSALDDVLVDRIGKQTDRALKDQLHTNSYQRDFKYTIFVLAGLLRYREAEPYAMLAERSNLARSILSTLEEIGRQLKRHRTSINSAAEKMLLVDELKSFLSGEGGDPNILRMIEDLRG